MKKIKFSCRLIDSSFVAVVCRSYNEVTCLLQSKLSLIVVILLFSTMCNYAGSINSTIFSNEWFHNCGIVEMNNVRNVYSVSVSGKCIINQSNNNSFVRVVVVTTEGDEKLIAEYSCFDSKGDTINISGENLEAYFDTSVCVTKLKVITVDASIYIDSIVCEDQQKYSKGDVSRIRKQHTTERINKINDFLAGNGMLWRAGETCFSGLSYSQLKAQLYGGSDSVFLHGYEYYHNGIFSSLNVATSQRLNNSSPYPKLFSWTRRHGRNWNTIPKNQLLPVQPNSVGNGGCWAFAPIALSECYANIYYNRHINLDLSEQDAISCSNGGSCATGGSPDSVVQYILSND